MTCRPSEQRARVELRAATAGVVHEQHGWDSEGGLYSMSSLHNPQAAFERAEKTAAKQAS